MSRSLGDRLPHAVWDRLRADRAGAPGGRVVLVCSVDGRGWPHPAMLGEEEVVATDRRCVRLAPDASSRTARHLAATGRVTLVLADADGVYYLKGTARPAGVLPAAVPPRAVFEVRLEEVRADAAGAAEGEARLVSGLRYEAGPASREQGAAIRRALAGGAAPEAARPEPATPS